MPRRERRTTPLKVRKHPHVRVNLTPENLKLIQATQQQRQDDLNEKFSVNKILNQCVEYTLTVCPNLLTNTNNNNGENL